MPTILTHAVVGAGMALPRWARTSVLVLLAASVVPWVLGTGLRPE